MKCPIHVIACAVSHHFILHKQLSHPKYDRWVTSSLKNKILDLWGIRSLSLKSWVFISLNSFQLQDTSFASFELLWSYSDTRGRKLDLVKTRGTISIPILIIKPSSLSTRNLKLGNLIWYTIEAHMFKKLRLENKKITRQNPSQWTASRRLDTIGLFWKLPQRVRNYWEYITSKHFMTTRMGHMTVNWHFETINSENFSSGRAISSPTSETAQRPS